jgi:O-antigen ligase
MVPTGAYLGFTRAALGASLVITALGTLLLASGWVRRGALALVVLVPLAALSSEGWRRRGAQAAANVVDGERRLAMTAGARMFAAHPVAGVGFGNHKFHAEQMADELHMPRHILADAHNVWLTVAAETGFVGVVLLALFHGLLARALWRGHRCGAWLASGALLSLVGYHVLGLVHYLPFHTSVSLSFQFAWGMGLAAAVRAEHPSSSAAGAGAEAEPSGRRRGVADISSQ